eukprot:TRINITY_DN3248_c0_g1_i1.p2 TRINITY_DN3248_c0_g1~~TRINITY_DN3248_c0_g1_i1.p2  ORF type:complete len:198 (-),score=25.96 TRINITY_DN3248_c0_g1_i1:655-1248(-)
MSGVNIVSVEKGIPNLVEPSEKHCGPTTTSNWVIIGRVLAGSFPGSQQSLKAIIDAGVTTFVCLVPDNVLKSLGSYLNFLEDYNNQNPEKKIKFLPFEIEDFQIAEEASVLVFIEKLTDLLRDGENLYIHCQGGHGRTGTIVGCLIGRLYNISPQMALKLTAEYHDQRVIGKCDSPETKEQINQVMSIVNRYRRENK